MQSTYDTWSHHSRGFWTKRKRSATSLLTVLALIAGIAVAFKLFDQRVPNNVVRDASVFDYVVYRVDDSGPVAAGPGEPIFVNPGPGGVGMYPGDTRTVPVQIENTNTSPAKDASFQLHIEDIAVYGCLDAAGNPLGALANGDCPTGATTATPTFVTGDPNINQNSANAWNRFVNFFTLSVDKKDIYFQPESNTDLFHDPDPAFGTDFSEACSGGLREITKAAPCELGMVRKVDSTDLNGDRTDIRDYSFSVTEADDGSDQSIFKGWLVEWTFVFNARLPALPESGTVVTQR